MQMISNLGLSSRRKRRNWRANYVYNSVAPLAVADYVGDCYGSDRRTTFDQFHSFSRGSSGWYFDSTGTFATTAPDVPRLTHGAGTYARSGLVVEAARTNQQPVSDTGGALLGPLDAGGALPTGFDLTGIGAGNVTVSDLAPLHGMPRIGLHLTGTPSSTIYLFWAGTTAIPATSAQLWSLSAYARLAAGSMANVSALRLYASGWSSSGAYVSGSSFSSADHAGAISGQLGKFTGQGTLTGAGVAHMRPSLRIDTSGPIDLTLDLCLPEAVIGDALCVGIPTSSGPVTQAQDSVAVTGLAAGTYDVVVRSTKAGETALAAQTVSGPYWPQMIVDDVVQSICFYPSGIL